MTNLAEPHTANAGLVVARLPIVDRDRVLIGFDLVQRSASASPSPESPRTARDEDALVTMSGLLGTVEFDVHSLVGDRLLFCAVDDEFLRSGHPLALPPHKTVVGVRAATADAGVVEACRALRAQGFAVSVEQLVRAEGAEDLLALADLVKIDLAAGGPGDVMDLYDACRAHPAELLAARCDTEAELSWAKAVGFDLFKGRAVDAPEIPTGSTIGPSVLSQVELGMELLCRDLDLDRVEVILRGDPALVVQLLNLASMGAGGGLRRQVRSLREALVVLGTVRLRQWAALVILGRHGRLQTDALVTGLVRGRMCELLAPRQGIDGAFAFTAGLLSTLDLVLGVELTEIERQIQVDDELRAASFHREGWLGELIDHVETYQQAVAWGQEPPAEPADLTTLGAMAFTWATGYIGALESAGQPEG